MYTFFDVLYTVLLPGGTGTQFGTSLEHNICIQMILSECKEAQPTTLKKKLFSFCLVTAIDLVDFGKVVCGVSVVFAIALSFVVPNYSYLVYTRKPWKTSFINVLSYMHTCHVYCNV